MYTVNLYQYDWCKEKIFIKKFICQFNFSIMEIDSNFAYTKIINFLFWQNSQEYQIYCPLCTKLDGSLNGIWGKSENRIKINNATDLKLFIHSYIEPTNNVKLGFWKIDIDKFIANI